MYMKDWVVKLDSFLQFSENAILQNSGKVSHEAAEALALDEFKKYKIEQDKNYVSDFDREVKKLASGRKGDKNTSKLKNQKSIL